MTSDAATAAGPAVDFDAGMGLELTCDAQQLPSPYCCVNVLRWPGLLRRRCGLAAIGNETTTKNAP